MAEGSQAFVSTRGLPQLEQSDADRQRSPLTAQCFLVDQGTDLRFTWTRRHWPQILTQMNLLRIEAAFFHSLVSLLRRQHRSCISTSNPTGASPVMKQKVSNTGRKNLLKPLQTRPHEPEPFPDNTYLKRPFSFSYLNQALWN